MPFQCQPPSLVKYLRTSASHWQCTLKEANHLLRHSDGYTMHIWSYTIHFHDSLWHWVIDFNHTCLGAGEGTYFLQNLSVPRMHTLQLGGQPILVDLFQFFLSTITSLTLHSPHTLASITALCTPTFCQYPLPSNPFQLLNTLLAIFSQYCSVLSSVWHQFQFNSIWITFKVILDTPKASLNPWVFGVNMEI